MDYFNLSFLTRLILAILSGLAPWFLVAYTGLLGTSTLQDVFFAPYAVSLALCVLVPSIRSSTRRLVRAMILVIIAVVSVTLAYSAQVLGGNYLANESLSVILAVLLGTVLIATATALVAPVKLTARYLGGACVAGLIAGAAFWVLVFHWWSWLCIKPCPWWNDWLFASGWAAWHAAILVVLHYGERQP